MILDPKQIIPLLGVQYGMTVLDIGSGVGFWSKQLSPLVGSSGKILALDISADVTARLNNDLRELGLENIFPITGDVFELREAGIAGGICDKILLVRMLDYFDAPIESLIEELKRVLKDSGELIIIDSASNIASLPGNIQAVTMPEIADRTNQYFSGIKITRS